MAVEQLLESVQSGVVEEAVYVATRQKAVQDLQARIGYAKRGYTRPPGQLARDLRLNTEAYGDMIRQGVVAATDKVEQLKTALYADQRELEWAGHKRYIETHNLDVETSAKRQIIESDNILQKSLADIRLNGERAENEIDLKYRREAREVDIRGDAASRLSSLQYGLKTELATTDIELANESQVKLIDLNASHDAQKVDLGYRRIANGIELAARIQGVKNEEQARLDVAIDVATARLESAQVEGNAQIEAANTVGYAKIEGVKLVSKARMDAALTSGAVRRDGLLITHDAKKQAMQLEMDAKLAAMQTKSLARITTRTEQNNAEISAQQQVSSAKIDAIVLDGANKVYTRSLTNDAKLAAETALQAARLSDNDRIFDAKLAATRLINRTDEQAAEETATLTSNLNEQRAATKLRIAKADARVRFNEVSQLIQSDLLNQGIINNAELLADAASLNTKLDNVNLKAAFRAEELKIITDANLQAERDVSSARVNADSKRHAGQREALDISLEAQEEATSKRLKASSEAALIRMIGRGNLQIIEAYDRSSVNIMDLKSKWTVASDNNEQSHTENIYEYQG